MQTSDAAGQAGVPRLALYPRIPRLTANDHSSMTIETKEAIGDLHPMRAPLPALEGDEKVTFADLVLAHHLRQKRLYDAATAAGSSDALAHAEAADKAYQTRLEMFQAAHGTIARAYWCTYQVSAVAITEENVRLPWWRLRRSEARRHIHAETDWATRGAPELAHQLHTIDNLAVRADEILRGTAENITMHLLLAAATHVLSYVDRKDGAPTDPATIKTIVQRSNAELADIRRYYRQAGENATRIVYAGGMLRGAALLTTLTTLAGLVLWSAHDFHVHRISTWTILATIAAGGLGASVSVLLRMARGNFRQDYEVGRKTTRRLAMARPFVGAAFAIMIYLLLRSGLVHIGGLRPGDETIYFYAAVGFLAGFSERWARVIISGVIGDDEPPPQPQPTSDRPAATRTHEQAAATANATNS
jgi:hypothetical protein